MTQTPTYNLDDLKAAVAKATEGEWASLRDGNNAEWDVVKPDARAIFGHWYVATCHDDADNATAEQNAAAIVALFNAARSGLLDDAALGRRVRAAAETDGPERQAMADAILGDMEAGCNCREAAETAARALVEMGDGK